ncbi:unnamed protein product [Gordionus sp. m RMFG-2023]
MNNFLINLPSFRAQNFSIYDSNDQNCYVKDKRNDSKQCDNQIRIIDNQNETRIITEPLECIVSHIKRNTERYKKLNKQKMDPLLNSHITKYSLKSITNKPKNNENLKDNIETHRISHFKKVSKKLKGQKI